MKIAILGFDVEGKASYDYFSAQGHEITICDQNPHVQLPVSVNSQLGENYLDNLDRFDLLLRTPGLHPSKILAKNPTVKAKISSGTNQFFENCPSKNIVGVTGTKGKGTTSTLITKILEADGKKVFLGGNIGTPALSFLKEVKPDDWVVLELSNFQLIDCKYSPKTAICLMVVPEHLDWHADMAEYALAKQQLFKHQTTDDTAIYNAENDWSSHIAQASPARKIPFMKSPGADVINGEIVVDNQKICSVSELKLLGKHNWQNVCAAITAVWQITQNVAAIRSAVTSFSGLPHRLEMVREIDGIRYYNDSFSSGLHSTIAAIEAIAGPKVMILGGYDRMLELDYFANYVLEHQGEFRKLLLIGESAKRLAKALEGANFDNFVVDENAKTMPEVVEAARRLASPGDSIVLSPGFASFDMFKNFEDRGLQFKEVVGNL